MSYASFIQIPLTHYCIYSMNILLWVYKSWCLIASQTYNASGKKSRRENYRCVFSRYHYGLQLLSPCQFLWLSSICRILSKWEIIFLCIGVLLIHSLLEEFCLLNIKTFVFENLWTTSREWYGLSCDVFLGGR